MYRRPGSTEGRLGSHSRLHQQVAIVDYRYKGTLQNFIQVKRISYNRLQVINYKIAPENGHTTYVHEDQIGKVKDLQLS